MSKGPKLSKAARRKVDEQFRRLMTANGEPIECAACRRKVKPEFDNENGPTWHYSCPCGAWASSVPATMAEA